MELSQRDRDLIELESQYTSEILNYSPVWWARWGVVLIGSVIILSLVISHFVRYPDTIQTQVTLTTPFPPVKVIAQREGNFSEFHIQKNGAEVKKGELVAVIENEADYTKVIALKSRLENTKQLYDTLEHQTFDPAQYHQLADISDEFALFLKSYNAYHDFYRNRPFKNDVQELNTRFEFESDMLRILEKQHQTLKQVKQLEEVDLKRVQRLFEKNVVPKKEVEEKQKAYLRMQQDLQNLQSQIVNKKLTLLTIESSIRKSGIDSLSNKESLRGNLYQAIHSLKNAIDQWEKQYIFYVPIDGKINLYNFWADNQYVQSGEEVFSVIPKKEQKIIGKMIVSGDAIGKIDSTQKVNVEFLSYPQEEFGLIVGQVKNASLLPKDNTYIVEVDFPNGLTTSYNKEIPFHQQLQGRAEIITKDYSLLQRVFYQLTEIINSI